MDSNKRPISQFSESICRKIPIGRWQSTGPNAHWILRNPVRLTSLEKEELIQVYRNWLLEHERQKNELNKSRVCKHGRGFNEVCIACLDADWETRKCK